MEVTGTRVGCEQDLHVLRSRAFTTHFAAAGRRSQGVSDQRRNCIRPPRILDTE
jgi:hypothetical protein